MILFEIALFVILVSLYITLLYTIWCCWAEGSFGYLFCPRFTACESC